MAIILRLDRVMADRKISLKDLAEQVGIANINLSKILYLIFNYPHKHYTFKHFEV